MPSKQRKLLGRYIVADPKICHGKPTFIGTRIMVWQILKQVARGKSWDDIVTTWGGRVTKEQIAEAVALAERTFEDHAIEYAREIAENMIILDENIPDEQETLLRQKRIHTRRVGRELGRVGMDDTEIIPLLHQLPRPTFFTLDADFYKRRLRHEGYCLVQLDVDDDVVAEYIRWVLGHSALNSKAKRMGKIIQASPMGLTMWRVGEQSIIFLEWD